MRHQIHRQVGQGKVEVVVRWIDDGREPVPSQVAELPDTLAALIQGQLTEKNTVGLTMCQSHGAIEQLPFLGADGEARVPIEEILGNQHFPLSGGAKQLPMPEYPARSFRDVGSL